MPVGCGVSLALRGTGERGQGTIPEFDPAVLQPSLTHASEGPHRVVGPPILPWVGCHGFGKPAKPIRGQFLILATPRPSQAIGYCPWKPWMNAACVPVSESGDGCPREILIISS